MNVLKMVPDSARTNVETPPVATHASAKSASSLVLTECRVQVGGLCGWVVCVGGWSVWVGGLCKSVV